MKNGLFAESKWSNSHLLIFTRYPEAGKTKTRLIPALGAERAALLQKHLTEKVVYQANLLAQRIGIEVAVHYAGGSREKMATWLGQVNCIEQGRWRSWPEDELRLSANICRRS